LQLNMKKIIYNKLVRDRIPKIIRADHGEPETTTLNDKKFIDELFKKLREESEELIKEKGHKKELIKEIGDVYEVIEAIIDFYELDVKEIKKLKATRKKERGGFKKRIYLKYVEK
jgi:predicted house-cleaning noncanonical NTP pyrophosphatase (MazG superfamily)